MTYDQLVMFVTVVEAGGFQAAARVLHISQPSVSSGVKKLEDEFSTKFFSRQKYRPELTSAGKRFYEAAKASVEKMKSTADLGRYLGSGNEPELTIAIGDIVPVPMILRLLKDFFANYPATRLQLKFEGVRGAVERVLDRDADFGITGIMPEFESEFETITLGTIQLIPVCAPEYPPARLGRPVKEEDLVTCVQVIIRDTARSMEDRSFGVVAGATSSCTVSDHLTKKDIIVAGLGWGRLPDFLIREELQSGRLVSLASNEITDPKMDLKAARQKNRERGPIAGRLWEYFQQLNDRSYFTLAT